MAAEEGRLRKLVFCRTAATAPRSSPSGRASWRTTSCCPTAARTCPQTPSTGTSPCPRVPLPPHEQESCYRLLTPLWVWRCAHPCGHSAPVGTVLRCPVGVYGLAHFEHRAPSSVADHRLSLPLTGSCGRCGCLLFGMLSPSGSRGTVSRWWTSWTAGHTSSLCGSWTTSWTSSSSLSCRRRYGGALALACQEHQSPEAEGPSAWLVACSVSSSLLHSGEWELLPTSSGGSLSQGLH